MFDTYRKMTPERKKSRRKEIFIQALLWTLVVALIVLGFVIANATHYVGLLVSTILVLCGILSWCAALVLAIFAIACDAIATSKD